MGIMLLMVGVGLVVGRGRLVVGRGRGVVGSRLMVGGGRGVVGSRLMVGRGRGVIGSGLVISWESCPCYINGKLHILTRIQGGPSALGKKYVDTIDEVMFSCKFIL